ncbi:MAG: Xaa-Pro peptidase family protein [Armatimonadota bacterium]|nr:Xaa-Pro peptidase family protein [Armatimonadota bacterium]MDR7403156.1 Xaa-Pro peptidase family protein [Armatimonadota bacterium]
MSRLERLRALLDQHQVDAMLVVKAERLESPNLRYLTGFTGSTGAALIARREAVLLVDFRYVAQARAEAPGWEVVQVPRQASEALAEAVRSREIRRLGFEPDGLTVRQRDELARALQSVEMVPVDGVDRLRWVKEPAELDRIRRAVQVADAAFNHILGYLRPGIAERDVALELEFFMRRHGAEREAFGSIVASGPRSALPHGRASEKLLAAGEFVTVDWGAVVDGYHSDCTRTVVLGRATERQREIYDLVLRAQTAALRGLRPGLTGRDADALARQVIADAGHGEHFGHGLGHGVGLAIHEGPSLSPREETVLEAGMVVTVEPGVYLPGWGGVRIEDLVVLTQDGCEILTRAPKELMEL